MKKTAISTSFIQSFVERQKTVPLETLLGDSGFSCFPYAEHWRRAVAAMLLSGRVTAKDNGLPNMTDVNRICKEANFNQYWFEQTARFLVSAEIIKPKRGNSCYEAAKFGDAFWNHRLELLQEAARHAFLDLVQQFTPSREWRPTLAVSSNLDKLVGLFAAAFDDLAIPAEHAGDVFLGFSKLPIRDLIGFDKQMGLQIEEWDVDGWMPWLDEPGRRALLSALYVAGWAYVVDQRKQHWFYLSDTARIILGLQPAPELPPPAVDFKVLPNFCVLAGADLPPEKLAPLFRHCRIKRIDRVFELQLEKKLLTETLQEGSSKELHEILGDAGPLPSTVDSLLRNKPLKTGGIRIRYCCAIVQPESPELLDAIRQHSRLKGYLEPGAPRGYLLIKPQSNPYNFVERCHELGFKVKLQQG